MFQNIINRYNKANNEKIVKERITKCDIILNEMSEEITRDLALRFECDMFLEFPLAKTEGDIIIILVMIKTIFLNKKYTEEWFGEKATDKIIYMIEFLHLPHSNYIRNYTRDIFRLVLSIDFDLAVSKLILVRNAIEESYDKNEFIYDDTTESEKIVEFSVFLCETFSANSKKFEIYEKYNPFFKSKYIRNVDHISGSLIGKAVGNSIGFLVEGQSSEICCEYTELVINKIVNFYGVDKDLGKTRSRYCKIEGNEQQLLFLYGQYTHDTQCSRELLMSIDEGKLNIEAFKRRLISMYGLAGLISWDKNSTVKTCIVGNAEISPIQNMANGVSWQESGKGEGNEACQRSAPLGALYMSRKDLCKSVSDMQAIGTNNCTKSRACSVLIAETTRLALENKIKPYARYSILKYPRVFCKQLVSSIMSIEPKMEKYILSIPDLIDLRKKTIRESKLEYTAACILADRQIVKIITTESAKCFGEKLSNGGETISSSSVQTCIFSIYCFLCIPDFYLSSVCMAIRAGGDTDTTASIVGGIVGARLGIESVPSYFVEKINDQGNCKSDELIQICQKLHDQNFVDVDEQTTTFGNPPQPSMFGNPPQPSMFGNPPQQSMFGNPPLQSMFGNPHQQSMFGNPPLQSMFGNPPQQSMFGNPLPPSMFGNPPQPSTFGKPLSYSFGVSK